MGARTSVLPDLLSQASPATPPRHDRSTSEEVRSINDFDLEPLLLNLLINLIRCDFDKFQRFFFSLQKSMKDNFSKITHEFTIEIHFFSG